MKLHGSIHNCRTHLLDKEGELVGWGLQVLGQDGLVDPEEGVVAREHNREGGKVALQPRVDCEAAGCWVHASDVLHVVDVLLGELVPVVPVPIVHVLADKGMRANSPIEVNLWHVHVIQEVN